MKQIKQQTQMMGIQILITVAMHFFAKATTPMLLATTQTLFQLLDPVFQQRVLGRAVEVKRPAIDLITQCVLV
jgi:hypothetical protein